MWCEDENEKRSRMPHCKASVRRIERLCSAHALCWACVASYETPRAPNIWWKISSLAFQAIASHFSLRHSRQMCSRRKFSFVERAFHIGGRVYKRRRWLDLTANRSQIKVRHPGAPAKCQSTRLGTKNKNKIKLIWIGAGGARSKVPENLHFHEFSTESGCFFFRSCALCAHHHHRRLAACCFVER